MADRLKLRRCRNCSAYNYTSIQCLSALGCGKGVSTLTTIMVCAARCRTIIVFTKSILLWNCVSVFAIRSFEYSWLLLSCMFDSLIMLLLAFPTNRISICRQSLRRIQRENRENGNHRVATVASSRHSDVRINDKLKMIFKPKASKIVTYELRATIEAMSYNKRISFPRCIMYFSR